MGLNSFSPTSSWVGVTGLKVGVSEVRPKGKKSRMLNPEFSSPGAWRVARIKKVSAKTATTIRIIKITFFFFIFILIRNALTDISNAFRWSGVYWPLIVSYFIPALLT